MKIIDSSDRKVIARLFEHCPESHRSIARDFDVTCPTIRNRVDGLRQWGVIQHFVECDAIHLTLKLNLPSSGKINFIMRYGLNEDTTGPIDATRLMTDLYPEEHWFTFFEPDNQEMLHYMTARTVRDVEVIVQEVKHLPYSEDVEAQIIYSSLKREGRTG